MAINLLFLGPDGSGKTTLVRHLEEHLPGRSARLYLGIGDHGWRLRIGSRLRQSLGHRMNSLAFWLMVFPLEIVLRRYAASHPMTVFLLIDRVPGDPLLRNWLLRALYRALLPKPTLLIQLIGKPGAIAARKPMEINESQVKLELEKWADVAEALQPGFLLEVDTTTMHLEDCAELIVAQALEISAHRAGGENFLSRNCNT